MPRMCVEPNCERPARAVRAIRCYQHHEMAKKRWKRESNVKMRQNKNCQDCGSPIEPGPGRVKYCEVCAETDYATRDKLKREAMAAEDRERLVGLLMLIQARIVRMTNEERVPMARTMRFLAGLLMEAADVAEHMRYERQMRKRIPLD